MSKPCRTLLFLSALAACLSHARAVETPDVEFPFKAGDRVQWIGSSSTRIGTWCRTMEFLLRTRHPELGLSFARGTTGGGTFQTGLKNMPVWMADFKPTVVLFNYGGNDAGAGLKGIHPFEQSMEKCVELAQDAGARVFFSTHQSGDIRVTSKVPFDMRKVYADHMLDFAKEKGWTMYDVHHPLEAFQLDCQKDVPDFTVNKDRIHLTDSAYVAWGFYLYDLMHPPAIESSAELDASGKVISTSHCAVTNATSAAGAIEFTRADSVLPLIPPEPIPSGNLLRTLPTSAGAVVGAAVKDSIKELYKSHNFDHIFDLAVASKTPIDFSMPWLVATNAPAAPASTTPPLPKIPPAQLAYASKYGQQLPARTRVPLEKHSRYMLKITGLKPGQYDITCEGMPIGRATDAELAAGVNLNTLLLDSKNPAPWGDFLKAVWIGKRLDEIGKTQWKFKVERVSK